MVVVSSGEQNQMGYSQALQTQENKNWARRNIRPACLWFIGDLYWQIYQEDY